jgi:tetratricopeptide (TPR) repeat protein
MHTYKKLSMARVGTVGVACAAIALCGSPLLAADLGKAEELYKHTDFERSLALLDMKSIDPATDFLIGRNYFMLCDFKKATEYLQRATNTEPNNSEYMDWLGRGYGRRAETSNMILAFGFASKARQAFERSVQLNPKNSDALSDLFDYYLEAPGFLGGGFDKASKIADQVAAIDPSESLSERSRLAQKHKEYRRAEDQLRQAVAAAPRSVGQLLELAKFLANQGRTHESDAILQQARSVAPESPRIWFAQANIYIKQNRNLEQARNLLQKYMQAPVTVDDPPKQEALRLLKQVGGV